MNNFKNLITKRNIMVGLSMVLAFLIVQAIATAGIFVDNTPKFDSDIKNPAYIAGIPGRILAAVGEKITDPFGQKEKQAQELYASIPQAKPPTGLLYKSIAKGVFAADDNGQRYYKVQKGTNVEIRTYKLKDGREIKVIIPLNK